MKNNNKIIDAAEKSGFNLEFRTKKILDEMLDPNNPATVSNLYRLNNEIIEIDIVGTYSFQRNHIVIECKGSSPNSHLILIEEQKQNKKLTTRLEINDFIRVTQFPELNGNFVTFTGDFFDDNIKRKSKDDTKNNFYKAQEQINGAIYTYAENLPEFQEEPTIQFILPLIVTNSKIHIINYENSDTTSTECKWAFQRVKNTLNMGNNPPLSYLVPVINIIYLKDFFNNSQIQDGSMTPKNAQII